MKQCTIAYTFYPLDYRVRRYAEALVEDHHEVHAIALRDTNDKRQSIINGVKVFHIQKRNFRERSRFDYLIKIGMFFIRGTVLLTINFIKYRYNVIHIHNIPDFFVFMACIPRLFGAKIVLDIHDSMPELYCEKFNKSYKTKFARILFYIEKHSVNFSHILIVANDYGKTRY